MVWDSSRCQSVCLCVCASTLSNMNYSETSKPIIINFYLEHYWGRGLTALGFGLHRIRTPVSMATYISHRAIMGKIYSSSYVFDWLFFILAVNKENHYISDGFETWQDLTRDL